ncbi:MAG TPA: hypothetical protein VGG69_02870 [Rhizomicrobium sp.]
MGVAGDDEYDGDTPDWYGAVVADGVLGKVVPVVPAPVALVVPAGEVALVCATALSTADWAMAAHIGLPTEIAIANSDVLSVMRTSAFSVVVLETTSTPGALFRYELARPVVPAHILKITDDR